MAVPKPLAFLLALLVPGIPQVLAERLVNDALPLTGLLGLLGCPLAFVLALGLSLLAPKPLPDDRPQPGPSASTTNDDLHARFERMLLGVQPLHDLLDGVL